jgi:hypothetical protein
MRFLPENLTLPGDRCAVCKKPDPRLSIRPRATGFLNLIFMAISGTGRRVHVCSVKCAEQKMLAYMNGGSW